MRRSDYLRLLNILFTLIYKRSRFFIYKALHLTNLLDNLNNAIHFVICWRNINPIYQSQPPPLQKNTIQKMYCQHNLSFQSWSLISKVKQKLQFYCNTYNILQYTHNHRLWTYCTESDVAFYKKWCNLCSIHSDRCNTAVWKVPVH